MAEEIQEEVGEANENTLDEAAAKPRLKIRMPNPLVYFFIGPFIS